MRPWQHARSSSTRNGRSWREDLPIHEFLDLTKAAHPDLRHRMVLHNRDLGPALAARAFPDRTDAAAIALGHVREDMRGEPALADWLALCDADSLPAPQNGLGEDRLESLIALATAHHRLADDHWPRAVMDLLTTPVSLCPDLGWRALAVLCNGSGPAIIRRVLGEPREAATKDGGVAIVDPAWIAEGMIWWLMGRRIPSLGEVVGALRGTPGS